MVTQSLNVKNKGKLKDVNLGVALQTFENGDHALSGKRMKRVGGP